MKSRLSLKNLARAALNSLLLINIFVLAGCYSSTKPTYTWENIDKTVRDICKNEYKTEVKTKLAGRTLWVYLPLDNILSASEKPQKYIEKFNIEKNEVTFKEGDLKAEYAVITIPDQEKLDSVGFDKKAAEKNANVWKVIRRALFSLKNTDNNAPHFFCVVTADIKNGITLQETIYEHDMKKFWYGLMSNTEFQHRNRQDMESNSLVIGDTEGTSINYRDITMKEFIAGQIGQRIKTKFQKPEVGKNVDIDKEIRKVIAVVLNIYDFQDFNQVELNNLVDNNKITLNKAAVLLGPSEDVK